MNRRPRGVWLALATATVVFTTPSSAQNILVQVLDAETSAPLTGAVAHLESPAGEVLFSRLSGREGRALFAGVEPGRYRVRAEMIGHATTESEVFGVVEGASVPLVLRLASRAIPLAGVEVTAESGPCEIRPTEEGRLLADIWEEVRKALSAAAVTDQQDLYRYSLVMYEQDLDAERTVVAEERTRRAGYMRTPFGSRPVEDLTEHGFVERGASEWTYHAPDAQVLLSDGFLDTHCFRLVDGGPEAPELVGLAFEPTGERENVPDISGTLWLDRESIELRWLDLTYENLEPDVRPGDATGRVEFQRLPEGAWIVPEWWIRMPRVKVEIGRLDRRRRIVGYRQSGGRVVEIVEAGGRDLGRGVATGALEGIVVDSLGLPIAGVRVGWVGSVQSVYTNGEGRFDMVGLMEGTYRVRFIDPDLEALGFDPPVITREVAEGVSSYVEFHMPPPRVFLADLCEDEMEPGTSALGGTVRYRGTDEPVVGAEVRVRWSMTWVTPVPREEFTELRTTTDRNGAYRFCGVPRREELTLTSSLDGVEGSRETLSSSGEEQARVHVVRYDR